MNDLKNTIKNDFKKDCRNNFKNDCNKKALSVLLFIFLLCSCGVLGQAYMEQTSLIYDSTLRFHVRADSDEKEAQERKLIVRDAVLRYVKEDVEKAKSAQELEQSLAQKTAEIARVAANAADGKPVHVYFTRERFPVRHYGAVLFPAGEYRALRVDIGRAQGHNWWCAFYPKLCYTPEKTFTLSRQGKKEWKKIITAAKRKISEKTRRKILKYVGPYFY